MNSELVGYPSGFQPGMIPPLSPREHVVTSGNMFGGHDWELGGERPAVRPNCLQCTGRPPLHPVTTNYPAPNVRRVEVENPGQQAWLIGL